MAGGKGLLSGYYEKILQTYEVFWDMLKSSMWLNFWFKNLKSNFFFSLLNLSFMQEPFLCSGFMKDYQ